MWDNPDFVAAVKATGRTSLINRRHHHQRVYGVPSCTLRRARRLQGVCGGGRVRHVRRWPRRITLARTSCKPASYRSTPPPCAQRSNKQTWSRPDAAQWAEAYSALFPPHQLLIESYSKANKKW